LCNGKITGTVKADKVTREEIGFMMAGKSFDDLQKTEFTGEGVSHD